MSLRVSHDLFYRCYSFLPTEYLIPNKINVLQYFSTLSSVIFVTNLLFYVCYVFAICIRTVSAEIEIINSECSLFRPLTQYLTVFTSCSHSSNISICKLRVWVFKSCCSIFTKNFAHSDNEAGNKIKQNILYIFSFIWISPNNI